MNAVIEGTFYNKNNNGSYLKRGSQPAVIRETDNELNISISFSHLIRGNCYIEYDNRKMTVHPGFSRFSKGDHNVCLRLGKGLDLNRVKPELKGNLMNITIAKKEGKRPKLFRKAA